MDTRVEVKPRREMGDDELDITPMIDIVFLLLAFFVVVSKMDPKPAVDLPIAKYGKRGACAGTMGAPCCCFLGDSPRWTPVVVTAM